MFKSVLSENQIDIILKRKSRVVWTQEELSNAFTIRYFSSKAYTFLRDQLNLPLPALSTLTKWAGKIKVTSGLLEDILKIMKIASLTMSDLDKVCVLEFDEMSVSSCYEYDRKFDKVIGPHTKMQVLMVRGLFGRWKQTIFADFDCNMTKELLIKIITRLHEINFDVAAIVCDCGGTNQGLWRDLNVSQHNSSFPHPCVDVQPIFVFADAPHLLKLIRNWLLDGGFTLSGGKCITKRPLKRLVRDVSTEVSSCYMLSEK